MRRASGVLEHGDRPLAPADAAPYLDDLQRLNAWFGGYAVMRRAITGLARRAGRPLVVADVGGARGDFARRLARARGRPARRIVVLDRDEASIVAGRRAATSRTDVSWVQADASALPLRAGSVDVVGTSLTLHHLEPDAAVASLSEMRRVARVGVVINDLMRSRLALAVVWLVTRVLTRHPYSRDDGPLSVRRAYTAAEIRSLARRAGFGQVRVRHHAWIMRLTAVLA